MVITDIESFKFAVFSIVLSDLIGDISVLFRDIGEVINDNSEFSMNNMEIN